MSIILKNAKVFFGGEYAFADVRVEGELIAEVAESVAAGEGDVLLELAGYTLYPGIINAHVHMYEDDSFLSDEIFMDFARGGVTTVGDMGFLGSSPAEEITRGFAERRKKGFPRVVTVGQFICAEGSYGWINPEGTICGVKAASPDEAAALVGEFARLGCEGVKTSMDEGWDTERPETLIPDEIYKAIFKRAGELGKWVAMHITQSKYLERALDFGDFRAAHIPRDTMPDRLLQKLVGRGIWLTPALSLYAMLDERTGSDYLPRAVENLRRYHLAGGRAALGNDMSVAASPFHEHGAPFTEMRLMQSAGMSVEEIMLAATRGSAEYLGIYDRVGSIEKGKAADLIAVKTGGGLERFKDIPFVMCRGTALRNECVLK